MSDCKDCVHINLCPGLMACRGFDDVSKKPCLDVNGQAKSTGTRLDPNSRHYDHGGIETLEVIKAKLTPEQYKGFLLGNVIKYSCRANFKGSFDRDVEKARFYSSFLEAAK